MAVVSTGKALVQIGRAKCKIAAIQGQYQAAMGARHESAADSLFDLGDVQTRTSRRLERAISQG